MVSDYYKATYPIGVVAEIIGVCARTLRLWEKKGLILPQRRGKNRYYSQADLDRLKYIKHLLEEENLNTYGVKKILEKIACWELKDCPEERKERCPVFKQHPCASLR